MLDASLPSAVCITFAVLTFVVACRSLQQLLTVKNSARYKIVKCKCQQGCGMRTAVLKSKASPKLACAVHCCKPRKWVRQTADVIAEVLRKQQLAYACLQEVPVRVRAASGRCVSGCRGKIDLVYVIGERVIAVEVQGSKEHQHSCVTKARDERKCNALQRASACELMQVWSPQLWPGGELQIQQWRDQVACMFVDCLSAMSSSDTSTSPGDMREAGQC
jgi:hypothetical protein